MSLKPASTPELPDLACLGTITEVQDAYLSEKGVYYVMPITISANYGGVDQTVYFLFQPRWFDAEFDPREMLAEPDGSKIYGVYRRYINAEDRPAMLAAMAGDDFEKLAKAFDSVSNASPEIVSQVLREFLVGREVGYIVTQDSERGEGGKRILLDRYRVRSWFPATEQGVKEVTERLKKSRTKVVVTWEE